MWNSAGTVTWALTWAAGWSHSSPHQQPLWECHCALCPVPLTVWGIQRAASASRGHFNAFVFFSDRPVSVSQWQWICDLCSMVSGGAGGGCPAPVPLTPTLLLFIFPLYTKHNTSDSSCGGASALCVKNYLISLWGISLCHVSRVWFIFAEVAVICEPGLGSGLPWGCAV